MKLLSRPTSLFVRLACLGLFCGLSARAAEPPDAWQRQHDQLVARLRNLQAKAGTFGAAYQPIYEAALPWYERWGGVNRDAVDAWMMSPEQYAGKLATALEQGKNFVADNPDSQLPLVCDVTLPGGDKVSVKYWLKLPAGFPSASAKFPLIIGLHGSGWLGHKISFVQGHGPGGPCFAVTPIWQEGFWRIDFLNAFLDQLLAALPIDRDRVYLEGHSLGGMATWLWALENPERFAAISPQAGAGEPYRAIRLKHVPSWVIHGGNDTAVLRGFAEQMVSALQSVGASTRYSILPQVEHNMPEDLDHQAVVDWYLRQTRSHEAPPPDPRDALGLGPAGYSPWTIIAVPEQQFWSAGPFKLTGLSGDKFWERFREAAKALFDRVHRRGEMADSPVRIETDQQTGNSQVWLAAPSRLRTTKDPDPALVVLPARRFVRFYGRGDDAGGFAHLRAVAPELTAAGYTLAGSKVWITGVTLWQNAPDSIAEYWAEIH
jgi:pimeloyl-ACP methyl ester carboxylesterase